MADKEQTQGTIQLPGGFIPPPLGYAGQGNPNVPPPPPDLLTGAYNVGKGILGVGAGAMNAFGQTAPGEALGTAFGAVTAPLGVPAFVFGDDQAREEAARAYRTLGGDEPGPLDVPAFGRAMASGLGSMSSRLTAIAENPKEQDPLLRGLAGVTGGVTGLAPYLANVPLIPPGAGRLAARAAERVAPVAEKAVSGIASRALDFNASQAGTFDIGRAKDRIAQLRARGTPDAQIESNLASVGATQENIAKAMGREMTPAERAAQMSTSDIVKAKRSNPPGSPMYEAAVQEEQSRLAGKTEAGRTITNARGEQVDPAFETEGKLKTAFWGTTGGPSVGNHPLLAPYRVGGELGPKTAAELAAQAGDIGTVSRAVNIHGDKEVIAYLEKMDPQLLDEVRKNFQASVLRGKTPVPAGGLPQDVIDSILNPTINRAATEKVAITVSPEAKQQVRNQLRSKPAIGSGERVRYVDEQANLESGTVVGPGSRGRVRIRTDAGDEILVDRGLVEKESVSKPVEDALEASGHPVTAGNVNDVKDKIVGDAADSVRVSDRVRADTADPVNAVKNVDRQTNRGQSPYNMTAEQLDREIASSQNQDKTLLQDLFGVDGAKRYKSLERTANSSTADFARSDAAQSALEQMESALTKEQRNRLYGIGESGLSLDELKDIRSAIGRVGGDTPQELGDSLKYALSELKTTDPLRMSHNNLVRYAQIREALRQARELGWSTKEVSDAAIRGVLERFTDPVDKEFMRKQIETLFKEDSASIRGARSITESGPFAGYDEIPNEGYMAGDEGQPRVSGPAEGPKITPPGAGPSRPQSTIPDAEIVHMPQTWGQEFERVARTLRDMFTDESGRTIGPGDITKSNALNAAGEVVNAATRAVKIVGDLEPLLRQGSIGPGYPVAYAKAAINGFRAIGESPRSFYEFTRALRERVVREADVALADVLKLEDPTDAVRVRNEYAVGPIIENIPVAGLVFRQTNYGFHSFINSMRATLAIDAYKDALAKVGGNKAKVDVNEIANRAQVYTGRGNLLFERSDSIAARALSEAAGVLFFAPRYAASMWQLGAHALGALKSLAVSPITKKPISATERMALRSAGGVVASGMIGMGIAKGLGLGVDLDPDNPTFGYATLPNGTQIAIIPPSVKSDIRLTLRTVKFAAETGGRAGADIINAIGGPEVAKKFGVQYDANGSIIRTRPKPLDPNGVSIIADYARDKLNTIPGIVMDYSVGSTRGGLTPGEAYTSTDPNVNRLMPVPITWAQAAASFGKGTEFTAPGAGGTQGAIETIVSALGGGVNPAPVAPRRDVWSGRIDSGVLQATPVTDAFDRLKGSFPDIAEPQQQGRTLTVGDQKIPLTLAQMDRARVIEGQYRNSILGAVVSTPQYQSSTPQKQKEAWDAANSEARRAGQRQFGVEYAKNATTDLDKTRGALMAMETANTTNAKIDTLMMLGVNGVLTPVVEGAIDDLRKQPDPLKKDYDLSVSEYLRGGVLVNRYLSAPAYDYGTPKDWQEVAAIGSRLRGVYETFVRQANNKSTADNKVQPQDIPGYDKYLQDYQGAKTSSGFYVADFIKENGVPNAKTVSEARKQIAKDQLWQRFDSAASERDPYAVKEPK